MVAAAAGSDTDGDHVNRVINAEAVLRQLLSLSPQAIEARSHSIGNLVLQRFIPRKTQRRSLVLRRASLAQRALELGGESSIVTQRVERTDSHRYRSEP